MTKSNTNETHERTQAEKDAQRTRCEVWTRVIGYHRPVSHFNVGKKAEHYSRKHFQECVADNVSFEACYGASVTA